MLKLLIIADDFTGALDTGVQFSKQGIKAIVTPGEDIDFAAIDPEIEVLVANIESRHLDPQASSERVTRLVKIAKKQGIQNFYKKTDSTLRGNIGAELAALLNECGRKSLNFIPAFPKSGRTTKNGVHYVDGVKLVDTVFAQDPFEPVKFSSVDEIIASQTGIKTQVVPLNDYGSAKIEPVEAAIRIFDAETDDDIKNIGKMLKESDQLYALAGCAGFAEILPKMLRLTCKYIAWDNDTDPMLVVTGSVNQVTIDQTNRAVGLGFQRVTLTPRQKLDSAYPESEECSVFIQEVSDLLLKQNKVIINSINDRSHTKYTDQYAMENNIDSGLIRGRIADNIGRITAQILSRIKVGSLVVFGGDTLSSVLENLECTGISPVLEITPGVVAVRIVSKAGSLNMITKSGGLGGEDVTGLIDDFVFSKQKPGRSTNRGAS